MQTKMLIKIILFLFLICGEYSFLFGQEKPRVIVLTDINNEPDDEESLVRFLVYSNEYNVEGLVATTSCWLRKNTREDLIRRQLDAYEKVRENLLKHSIGFPEADDLRQKTCTGQQLFGLNDTGAGKSTAGSSLIFKNIIREDTRPLWILLWGGANTLAQALIDLRNQYPDSQIESILSNVRIYSISDQDDAGPWIRHEFPTLFYVVDPSNPDSQTYYSATWNGISGDRNGLNGPMYKFELVEHPWLETHIMKNHGPLGACYRKVEIIMEGDSPSFLGLINNGLGWEQSPEFGGWGGRYKLYRPYGESRPIWTSNSHSRDKVEYEPGKIYMSNGATIWRWREHYQHDFAARMDWCIADSYHKANHNPIAILNGDSTKSVVHISVDKEQSIELSACGSYDPDIDQIYTRWWIYPEAGTIKNASLTQMVGETTKVVLPENIKSGTLHVILEIKDSGEPTLWSYRRVIISVGNNQNK